MQVFHKNHYNSAEEEGQAPEKAKRGNQQEVRLIRSGVLIVSRYALCHHGALDLM